VTQFGVRSTFRSEAARRIEAAGRAFALACAAEPPRVRRPVARPVLPAGAGAAQSGRGIVAEVAAQHGVAAAEILSHDRRRIVVLARHDAIWRCAAETAMSLPQLGRLFGRDHSSIGWAIMSRAERTGEPPPRGMAWACLGRAAGRRR